MPIELKVQETKKVEEGKHPFEIVNVEERVTPYHYIDIFFKLTDVSVTIKEGYSAYISETSKLGKLLKEFGVWLQINSMVDLEKELIGKTGTLMTINERSEKGGMFARVVDGSVHLLNTVGG